MNPFVFSKKHVRVHTQNDALIFLTSILLIFLLLLPVTKSAGITEFSLPSGRINPYGIVEDGNGFIWFTVFGSDQIGRLTPPTIAGEGAILSIDLPLGSRPWKIVHENGFLWFTESSTHKIARLEIDGSSEPGTLLEFDLTNVDGTIAPGPRGIALEGGDRIWFTEFDRGSIGALDITPNFYSEFRLPDENCGPLDILFLEGSGVWFTEFESHRIGNFNPDLGVNGILREWNLKPGSFPWGISSDSYGNIWFTESGRNRIAKLNPYTNEITEYQIPTLNSQPYGIIVDPANDVWFVEHGANKIGRYTPGKNVFTEFTRQVGGGPWDIISTMVGGDQYVWFSDESTNRIGRIDPEEAITTATVFTLSSAITESSTATTIGSSTATSTFSGTTNGILFSYSNTTTTSTKTSYKVSETEQVLKTSTATTSTSQVTFTATGTVTSTSFVATVTDTTSITATNIIPETSTASLTLTTTSTRFVTTTTIPQTFTTTTTANVTSISFGTAMEGIQIPGFSGVSIGLGLILGVIAVLGMGGLSRLFGPNGHGTVQLMKSKKWGAVLLGGAIVGLMVSLPIAQAAAIVEWGLPPGSNAPYTLTFDDQTPFRVWFTEFGSDRIGRLDTITSEIFELKLELNSRPWGIDFEPARRELWFTMSGSRNKIGVIQDLGNTVKEYRLLDTYAAGPRGIMIQPFVNGTDFPYIWFAYYGAGKIGRLDPYDEETITYWNLPAGAQPQAILFSKETGVWYTDVGRNVIGNLNPTTGEIKEFNINADAWDLTSDSQNNIWYTNSDHIGKLNPYSGEILRYRLPDSGSQAYGITIDNLGRLWIAAHGLNQIVRFSPDDLTFITFVRSIGGAPWGMATSDDNKIWFSDDAGNRIGKIDPDQALTSITTNTVSTASQTTSTITPATETSPSITFTTTHSDAATTRTTAPTTVTTTYGITETVRIIERSITETTTKFSNETVVVIGTSTSFIPTTVATVSSTSTQILTRTTFTPVTTTGVSTQVSSIINTVTTTTTVVTTAPGFGAIPGFSAVAILVGLAVGLSALTLMRTVRMRSRR